ncbi:hypothetical protein GURASL_28030 [Geotalea uraniireducens]|uniref:Uncharacterized protein n=1 Tax=Geotalea uraniireducens TaxID=351604 RepID=A0ABN6VXQ9_9BACT|nr:hypothetical protein GURASL_28030 [Geotalea uraniireducens]
MPAGAPPEFAATFATIRRVMTAFPVLLSLAMAPLFGWLIRRLTAVECRQEFGR